MNLTSAAVVHQQQFILDMQNQDNCSPTPKKLSLWACSVSLRCIENVLWVITKRIQKIGLSVCKWPWETSDRDMENNTVSRWRLVLRIYAQTLWTTGLLFTKVFLRAQIFLSYASFAILRTCYSSSIRKYFLRTCSSRWSYSGRGRRV